MARKLPMKLWYAVAAAAVLSGGWVARAVRRPVSPSAATVTLSVPPDFRADPDAVALVRSAILLERSGDSSSARTAYLRASGTLPPIRDWLRLRAAILSPDSAERAGLYRGITSEPAAGQRDLAEARVRERLGDIPGAIQARGILGQTAEVFRLRLQVDGATRPAVLTELAGMVRDSGKASSVPSLVTAALPFVKEMSGLDALLFARASAGRVAASQSVTWFERARQRGAALSAADRFQFGEALFSVGRYREAARELARVTSGSFLPGAMLTRGRSLLRAGQGGSSVLQDLVRRFPNDSLATPTALFLLGDLARDAGDHAGARRWWLRVGQRFPASEVAPRARFMAAMLLWTDRKYSAASQEWDSLALGDHGGEESSAAKYWAGRAWLEAGDKERAKARWKETVESNPLSYYAILSARRLGIEHPPAQRGNDTFPVLPSVRSAAERMALLRETGLVPEFNLEARWLANSAGDNIALVLASGDLLRDFGRAALATQLGWRAHSKGSADGRTYRLIFPLSFEKELSRAARRQVLEPALVAALIRQESLFDSSATSRAGARGLMQVMPGVGRQLARVAGRQWHPDSLYHSGFNLDLGSSHLAGALRRYSDLERTLAAYNAGGSRVTRWARQPGVSDAEVFVESIPFKETRTYVRTVLRNLEFYRALYQWSP